MVFPLFLHVVVMTLPRRSSGPMSLAAVWLSADHWCGQRETLLKRKPLVDEWGVAEQDSSYWQPLLNKHGMVWCRTKGTHNIDMYSFPASTDTFFQICHLWLKIYCIFKKNFYCISISNSFVASLFFSSSHLSDIFPSVHLSISLSCWIQGFSVLLPAQSNIVFNTLFAKNEPISGFSRLVIWH